ncbi:MAG TPA: hypothetical protein VKG63_13305 [Steroidobacteraceae bacterium]|nr:hypothetical protein [Steroidobacteraceae bacterium]
MSTYAKLLVAMALLAGPGIASAADAVTYNFTGVVTSGPATIGGAVTGTFTFMYNGSSTITGTVGSSSSWEIQADGQPYTAYYSVFSSVVTGSGRYESSPDCPPDDRDCHSYVNWYGTGLSAYEAILAYPTYSYLNITGSTPSPFKSPGYAVNLLSMGASANGGYAVGPFDSDIVQFTVTSLTLAPGPQLAALLTEVSGIGPGRSLTHKVTAAQAYYAASDTEATCAMLAGFVNEVRAQNGKKIGQTLDAKLIANADAIEAAIGCSHQIKENGFSGLVHLDRQVIEPWYSRKRLIPAD